jgi:hypothetical protein
MAHVKIYQYDYYDPLLKCERRSLEFAIADTIMERGGTIIAESMREVDEDLVDDTGVVPARDLPPRGEFRKTPIAPRRPDGPRLGTG